MTRRQDELAALSRRWAGVPAETARVVRELLGTGRAQSPFGLVQHRQDLRGLPVSSAVPARAAAEAAARNTEEQTRWTALDLTGARLQQARWTDQVVSDCVLDDADLSGLRCWGVHVEGSSFVRADLRHGQLGPGADAWPVRSRWERVDLRSADLRGVVTNSVLRQLDLGHAKLRGARLSWSDLDDCRFAGVIVNLTVGQRPVAQRPADWLLRAVDLRRATLRDCQFIGVDLGRPEVDIRWPEGEGHWHVRDWPGLLSRVGSVLPTIDDPDLRSRAGIWHEFAVSGSGPRQLTGYLAEADLRSLGGDPLVALVADLLPC